MNSDDQQKPVIRLWRISVAAAEAMTAGRIPAGFDFAPDYPTEFSTGIAAAVGTGSPLGPFFIQDLTDNAVVGEIGGGFVAPGTVEIGYAVVQSRWGSGIASAAVAALVELASQVPEIRRLVAHTPLDRPASGRVVANAGFVFVDETDDQHDGVPLRVHRWELCDGLLEILT